eukprot:CAMPEP_0181052016 /NCGR_PEP_ID=MMETSP1070-20121207/17366_1 /TAXON_ID=265543 /ORGANISM="Minutocellus polymorphus, Strain NH13" /LENGTH=525 /DNA_ID=CAMNT_0023131083 /DNA_START=137 /DNA_END=1711 /DNA_ORIENTATION=+
MPTLLLIRRYSQIDEGTAGGGSERRRAVAVFDQGVSAAAAMPGSVVSSVAAPFPVSSTKHRGRRKTEHGIVRTEPVAGAGGAGKEGSRKRAAVLVGGGVDHAGALVSAVAAVSLDDGADHAGALVSAAAREHTAITEVVKRRSGATADAIPDEAISVSEVARSQSGAVTKKVNVNGNVSGRRARKRARVVGKGVVSDNKETTSATRQSSRRPKRLALKTKMDFEAKSVLPHEAGNTKAASEQDCPQGVYKVSPGKFVAQTSWRGKTRYIGTFGTPEHASAAYMFIKNDVAAAKVSLSAAHEEDAVHVFNAAKKKAVEAVGGVVVRTKKSKFPQGVRQLSAGKFSAITCWGGKNRYIGTLDTPEQASAAYKFIKNYLPSKPPPCCADKEDAMCDAAQTKALETVGGFVSTKKKKKELPQGVHKVPSGRFAAKAGLGGKCRYIGTFDTPEQASAAYVSKMRALADTKVSSFCADEAKAVFDVARKKALESVGGFIGRELCQGVHKGRLGKRSESEKESADEKDNETG